jgi:hypothetical protein
MSKIIIENYLRKYAEERKWNRLQNSVSLSNSEQSIRDDKRKAQARWTRPAKTGRQWQLEDYCKYCTSFLTPSEEDPCVQCGIRDAIREELGERREPT